MARTRQYLQCLSCDKELVAGRLDKKFCDELCKSAFHADARKQKLRLVNRTNKILLGNWEILNRLNPEEKATVSMALLEQYGFNFSYFTQVHQTNTEKTYYFCYDQGYLYKDNNSILLVKKKF